MKPNKSGKFSISHDVMSPKSVQSIEASKMAFCTCTHSNVLFFLVPYMKVSNEYAKNAVNKLPYQSCLWLTLFTIHFNLNPIRPNGF